MIGLGTLINVGTIVLGGFIGLFLKKLFSERLQQSITKAIGVCVMFIGISGALGDMLVVSGAGAGYSITVTGSLMMILAVVLGTLVGELINIEWQLEKFGNFLRRISGGAKDDLPDNTDADCKDGAVTSVMETTNNAQLGGVTLAKKSSKGNFIEGFLTASFTVCIGAMAVIGAINDGLHGDISLLVIKSILDFVSVMILTSTFGNGCIFSAIPVLIFQGLFTLLAKVIQPVLTTQATLNLGIVGSVLIFCVGVNLFFGKKVKVANMLPAIVFAVAFAFIPGLSAI